MNSYPNDYWYLDAQDATGNYLEDNTSDLELGGIDFAVEANISAIDLSAGYQTVLGRVASPNSSYAFLLGPSGHLQLDVTETGTTITTVNSASTIYALTPNTVHRNGRAFPYWVRWEFDYDDGATQSRFRGGVSWDRGQEHPWQYSAWTNVGTGLFDIAATTIPMEIGAQQNQAAEGNINIYQMVVYDNYDDYYDTVGALDSALWKFYPWDHAFDGTGTNPASMSWSNDSASADPGPTLITRASGRLLENSSQNHWIPATNIITDWEDRAFFMYGRHFQDNAFTHDIIDSDDTLGSGGRVQAVWDVTSDNDFDITFNDGTNNLTVSNVAVNTTEEELIGVSMDSTNFYVYANGTLTTQARGSVTGSFNWTTDRDLEFMYDSHLIMAAGTFPIAIDTEAEWDGLKTMVEQILPGRSGSFPGAPAYGSGWEYNDEPVLGPPASPPITGWYDTWTIYFDGASVAAWQVDIEEIELYTTKNATGTNQAENTDVDEDTRATYPFATAYKTNGSNYVAATPLYQTNYMIDGSNLTSYAMPELATGEVSSTAATTTSVTIHLETPVKIRSAVIRYNGNIATATPIYMRASRRDGGLPVLYLGGQTLSLITDEFILQDLQ
jgi:hypothetical protein